MYYKHHIIFIFLFLVLLTNATLAQETVEEYEFDEAEEEKIKEYPVPEAVEGYRALLKFLQNKISNGDTLGKKYSVHLYNVRFRVNTDGVVDTAFVAIPHSACPLHTQVIKFLIETKWHPATTEGEPTSFVHQLYGKLYFNKNILRKYKCW